jgi:hypothetical protein
MKTTAKKLATVYILILYFLKQFKWARTIFALANCLTGKLHSRIISGRANAERNCCILKLDATYSFLTDFRQNPFLSYDMPSPPPKAAELRYKYSLFTAGIQSMYFLNIIQTLALCQSAWLPYLYVGQCKP